MLLDQILLNQLENIGQSLTKKAGLTSYPKSCEEMYLFLKTAKNCINNFEFDGLFLGNILYSMVSSLEIRDRLTTSRIFEDIFNKLFGQTPTDLSRRPNPAPTKDISKWDYLNDEKVSISTDFCVNKREKADMTIGDYYISLKTLKGVAYDENGSIMDIENNKENSELNIGSFSFRALFKGILDDGTIDNLSDRRGGLGSATQVREHVLDPIKVSGKMDAFYERLKSAFSFVYDDDIYIVLKSNYLITFYLIPNDSFKNVVLRLYKEKECEFEKVWYRWENNNLRFRWRNMLDYMTEFGYKYYKIDIPLGNVSRSKKILQFAKSVELAVKSNLNKML